MPLPFKKYVWLLSHWCVPYRRCLQMCAKSMSAVLRVEQHSTLYIHPVSKKLCSYTKNVFSNVKCNFCLDYVPMQATCFCCKESSWDWRKVGGVGGAHAKGRTKRTNMTFTQIGLFSFIYTNHYCVCMDEATARCLQTCRRWNALCV